MRQWEITVLMLVALALPMQAFSHEMDPGYLELSAMDHDRWRVTWRVPDVGGAPMSLAAKLPDGCDTVEQAQPHFDGRGWSSISIVHCADGLVGGRIVIGGLERARTDVLVRYETGFGEGTAARLTPAQNELEIASRPGHAEVLATHVVLGGTHIIEGFDHLLFVLALLLLVRNARRLLLAVTAFTIAHSITLAAAATGWLRVPSSPVEVVIALSIVFLAWELAKPPERRDPVAEQFPAVISFSFGLVHGLGFAGALREIGLPQHDIPTALFAFNLGVELGQIAFIGAVLGVGAVLEKVVPVRPRRRARLQTVTSYLIGSMAAFWAIQRFGSF